MRQKIPLSIKFHKSTLNVVDFLNAMKREDVCKHRQAVKTMQYEKKYFKTHLHSFKLGKSAGKHPTSAHQKLAANIEKTKKKTAFLF